MVTRSRRLRRAVKLSVRTAVVVPHAERLIATMRQRYRERGGASPSMVWMMWRVQSLDALTSTNRWRPRATSLPSER
jgi:hypothetical protein